MTPQKIFEDLVEKAKNDAFAAQLRTAALLDDPIEKISIDENLQKKIYRWRSENKFKHVGN